MPAPPVPDRAVTGDLPARSPRRRSRRRAVVTLAATLGGLVVLLVVAGGVAISLGPVSVPRATSWRSSPSISECPWER
ncbi:hypothetical protein [Thermocatellispora tengchongensis]|uniref:hypothetical protein n=1 Tax=Thermocatellispora tengchongensis TaxID=1073253 RepID=UPI003626F1BA